MSNGFEELFKVKDDVNIVETESIEGVSAKRQQFLSVTKLQNKWRARIRHPKLKVNVHLGCYSTPEESALVVKPKKVDCLRTKRRRHVFEGRELPSGVTRERGKFRVRAWHPVLKKTVSCGYFSTREEAVVVADRKRAELRELYGEKLSGEDDDEVLQERGNEVAAEVECSDVQTRNVKVLAGVRRVRSGKRVARIWSGTYDTPEEFIRYYNKKIAVQMGSDGLNSSEMSDKLECEFVHGSRTSNIEPGMSGDKRVIDKESQRKTTFSLDFDDAVSAGFINEYGQLVGKYRELDEQLYLGLPEENVAASR